MMQEPNAALAAWLRTTRTEVGLTQVLLAEKAGIESRTIIKIESGQGNPTFSTLYPMIPRFQCVHLCAWRARSKRKRSA